MSVEEVTASPVGDAPPTASGSARWWTLGVVTLATAMLMLDLNVVNVALPDVRASLKASEVPAARS